MQSTIHLSGDEDLKIGCGPDGSVQIEMWNPMDALKRAPRTCPCPPSDPCGCPGTAWPQPFFHRTIDRPSARLIASALLAAASAR